VKISRLLAGLATAAALALPAVAAEDPIAVRQALMSSNGAAGAVTGAILKDELAYSPQVGKSVIATMHAVASAVGDYFPEGSLDPARSEAAPKIWEDPAGFTAALAKFQEAAAAANKASGRAGPPDKAAFGALIVPVLDSCKGCHETYRTEN
jgi:cytochrome c556